MLLLPDFSWVFSFCFSWCPKLFRHRVCDSRKCSRPDFPSIGAGACVMDAGSASGYDAGGLEQGQPTEPEPGAFCLSVPVLVGLNGL